MRNIATVCMHDGRECDCKTLPAFQRFWDEWKAKRATSPTPKPSKPRIEAFFGGARAKKS